MPRIRTIKPDAYLSESLSSVPRGTRWTFAGLWTYADDKGRARDDARLIKAALYPLDDSVTLADVCTDLELLTGTGAICRYVVEGRNYLHMPAWDEHQKINRPTPAKSPPCPLHEDGGSGHVLDPEDSVSDHGGLSESSTWEGKGKEGKGKGTPLSEPADAAPDEPTRDDVERLCEHLARSIVERGARKPSVTKAWRDAARLLLDRDGYAEVDVHWLIDRSADDDFWRSNILSMPTLRKQADKLKLKFGTPGQPGNVRQLRRDEHGEPILPPLPPKTPWGHA